MAAVQFRSPDPALVLPFACRGAVGTIEVHYGVTTDPVAVGFGLIVPDFDEPRFRGFPVVRAEVSFSGDGYRAVFGWLQLLKIGKTSGEEADAEIDLPPLLAEADSPLIDFGYLPTLFDAPANPHHPDGEWIAESFLVAVPDIARSRRLTALTGFRWGYSLTSGIPTALRVSAIGPDRWQAHQPTLAAAYPNWSFLDSTW